MTRDDAISRIKRKLSFLNATTLDGTIVEALQDAQRKLENSAIILPNGIRTPVPWFLEVADEVFPLVAGTSTYDLPVAWLKEMEDHPPYCLGTDGGVLPLVKTIPAVIKEVLQPVDGPPQTYYFVKKTIVIAPVPTEAIDMYLSYVAKDEVLSTNIENAWLREVPELLMGVAGAEIAGDKRDASALAEFEKLIVAGGAMLWDQKLTREMTNRRSAIGVVR